jgi:cell division protein FtsB
MAARKHLKAVSGAGEAVVVMSVSDAAESGSRLAELRAMRRVIARRIDDEATQARDLAALSKRQMDISREIEDLMNDIEGDALGKAADSPDETFNPSSV